MKTEIMEAIVSHSSNNELLELRKLIEAEINKRIDEAKIVEAQAPLPYDHEKPRQI